jgi:hypothetical protein
MFDWALNGLGDLFGFVGDAAGAVAGWAWDKVITGIYTWLANGLALLIEWVWSVLDSATTPRVTADWLANDLAVRVGLLALAVTIAMMLASAIQAALAGRPEQITDAVKHGIWAIVASALTLTMIDVGIRLVDEAAAGIWQLGRPDLVRVIERMVAVATTTGPLGTTFVGPLCLLFGFLGLIGLVVALLMRSALIYLAAALAPIVFSANVLPLFRGSARKLVHLTVALIVSKLAIVISLVVAVRLLANPAGDPRTGAIINDASAAVGTLLTGFLCFVIAAISPVVLYRLMPTVEGAIVGAGIAGGWMRGASTAAHTALMAKSLGATGAASAATRGVAGQAGSAASPAARGGISGLGAAGTVPGLTATPPAAGRRAEDGNGGTASESGTTATGTPTTGTTASGTPASDVEHAVSPPLDTAPPDVPRSGATSGDVAASRVADQDAPPRLATPTRLPPPPERVPEVRPVPPPTGPRPNTPGTTDRTPPRADQRDDDAEDR